MASTGPPPTPFFKSNICEQKKKKIFFFYNTGNLNQGLFTCYTNTVTAEL